MKTIFLLGICMLLILAFTLQNHLLARARRERAAAVPSGHEISPAPGEQSAALEQAPPAGPEPGSRPGTFVYYQYVDEGGAVRFAERLEQVPATWRERAGRVELASPPPATRAQARASTQLRDPERERREPGLFRTARGRGAAPRAPASRSEPAAVAGDQDSSRPDVQIYTMEGCGYCRIAMEYMDSIGQPYTNHDIEEDDLARDEYLEKTGGRQGVPVIDVEGKIMQGWSQARLDALLRAARER